MCQTPTRDKLVEKVCYSSGAISLLRTASETQLLKLLNYDLGYIVPFEKKCVGCGRRRLEEIDYFQSSGR